MIILSVKAKKLIMMIFTLGCFAAAGVCFIVNVAVNRQITWASYPLLSISFGWAVLLPLLVKKHGFILLLCALTLLILPYLYVLSMITPATDWFVPVGLPSAIAGMSASWVLFPLFRFTKMNIWYKSAISVFLLGAVCGPVVNYFIDIYSGENPFYWYRYLSIILCIIASAVFGILGYMKSAPKSESRG